MVTFAQVAGDDALPPDIHISGPPSFQALTLDGRVVLERAGSHFGRPRLSPDGTLMAITVVPAGTETTALAEIYVIERSTGRVRERVPGHNPRWQTGRNNRLRFDRLEANSIRQATYDIASQTITPDENLLPDDNPPTEDTWDLQPAAVSYPETIRVAHHPENNCRNVPDWQVDTIPFEEYVARSVPAEVPISWSPEVLAAQAVATRTYAWYQIRRKRRYYDVTDWANFQMMCNARYSSTDAAVSRTAGQYLSHKKDSADAPIIAMYSAKNSHPTLTNPAAPYLQSVPDEASIGEVRWGHGYGLSQWGAARRAKAGQTYRQLLGHYYTDVTLQNAHNPSQPIGGFAGLPLRGYLPPGGLRWGSLVPAHGLSGVVKLDPGPDAMPLNGVWLRSTDLSNGDTITAALSLSDQLQESVALEVDWDAPAAPIFTAPKVVEVQKATLTVATAERNEKIGISSNWIWQGENLYHTAGEEVDDSSADGNRALEARADDHEAGWWYGPYAKKIPHEATYRVLFRLRMGEPEDEGNDGILPDQPIARLDVTDKGGTLRLGLRDIWPSDFSAADRYVDIPVDFHIFNPVQGLEFRLKWHGEVDLALDRVQLWQLQSISRGRISWDLPNSGISAVSVVAFDAARNASPVVTRQIEYGSEQPPVLGEIENLHGWWTISPVTLAVAVQDFNSGLDTTSGELLLDDEVKTAQFSKPNDPLAEQKLSASISDLADGSYTVRFRAKDRTGLQGESEPGLLRVDRTAPVVTAAAVQEESTTPDEPDSSEAAPEASRRLLFSGPVTITIKAEDATSGVWGIAYVHNNGSVVLYDEPFQITRSGIHQVRYWAKDKAGNYTRSHRLSIWIRSSGATGQTDGAGCDTTALIGCTVFLPGLLAEPEGAAER